MRPFPNGRYSLQRSSLSYVHPIVVLLVMVALAKVLAPATPNIFPPTFVLLVTVALSKVVAPADKIFVTLH